ncbi:MAG: hypothetical protein KatS3mg082_3126 [Nitrospiraceae bacterium]|nr:MAG: hypothetical protein KatS3mg082_3126 [Nitrospiraceae bacterium]
MQRTFDPALAQFIEDTLSPGDVFADVGANVGYYSALALARVGERGEVHAFEVDPRSLRCLRRTRARNQLKNFVVHAVAVGDRCDTVALSMTRELGHTYIRENSRRSALFPMLPLDVWASYFAGRGLRLVKIDVEGAELRVLRGARNVLERIRPLVVCEVVELNLARYGVEPADVMGFMESVGYEVVADLKTFDRNVVFAPV